MLACVCVYVSMGAYVPTCMFSTSSCRWFFNVYAFGLYYDAEKAQKELQRWNSYDIDELRVNMSFYQNLISSTFCKAVCMKTARNIKGADLKVCMNGVGVVTEECNICSVTNDVMEVWVSRC